MLSDTVFILGLLLKLFSVYYIFIGLFVFLRQKKRARAAPSVRFAVVLPARNEEKVIGQLIESLKLQDYPDELFDIYVAVNNCTDDTAAVAEAHGARVFECRDVKCKGDVLEQCLGELMDEDLGYDAFCVFDSDNVVDRRFLAECNDAFMSGSRVVKGRNEAKNAYDSWVSGCYAIYFRMGYLLYSRPRSAIGLSAKMIGTGFAVHRNVLEELGGWHTVSLTEDIEFAEQCAERGIRIDWAPDAVTYEEHPNSFSVSLTQRKRWCSGIVEVGRLRLGKLLRSMKGGRRALKADCVMYHLNPFAQALAFIPAAISIVLIVLPPVLPNEGLSLVGLVAAAYVGGCLGALAITIFTKTWNRRLLKSILTYPIFLASWLPLQVLAIFHTTRTWEQIDHTRDISLSEVA
ncbi:MAG: glycosyltransferase [Oscillospiraceae bacterium]|jgi:cellulose synthase/poly-beta-1,6-N-acetylglucosamine synthase-like glycosyltransferase|nr:glycosyltransferase [Oscillospiraceae bacterium]